MRVIGRLILGGVFLVLTALVSAAATYMPGFFELYIPLSRKAMAYLAGVFAPLPFPVWQVGALLLVMLAVYFLVRAFSKKKGLLRWAAGMVLAGCVGIFLFTALWGLNHRSPGIETRLGLSVTPYSAAELEAAARYYGENASRLATQVPREPDTDMATDLTAMGVTAGAAFRALEEQYPFFRGGSDAPVKPLLLDDAFRYTGITGIFVCFTGESGVSAGTYAASLPHTMCHEAAHRLGVAPEEEANFCAFLACRASTDPAFQYSGYYSAFITCYNALHKQDPQAAKDLWGTLDPALVSDLRRANDHYDRYEGKVQETAEKLNDSYLKAMGQEEGVRSYGAADLLIAWYLQEVG